MAYHIFEGKKEFCRRCGRVKDNIFQGNKSKGFIQG